LTVGSARHGEHGTAHDSRAKAKEVIAEMALAWGCSSESASSPSEGEAGGDAPADSVPQRHAPRHARLSVGN